MTDITLFFWLFCQSPISTLSTETYDNRGFPVYVLNPKLVSEKAMAPHSSTLAWKISWTEEPGRLQSMGSLRVGHDWVTSLSLFIFLHWRRKWQPTPVFLPGESQGRGLPSMGLHRVGHDWSDLAVAADPGTGKIKVITGPVLTVRETHTEVVW